MVSRTEFSKEGVHSKGLQNVDPKFSRALHALSTTPGQEGITIQARQSHRANVGFEVKYFDPARHGLRVIVRGPDRVAQVAYVHVQESRVEEATRYINGLNQNAQRYFSRH